jgi:hypothetical protein
MIFKSSERTTLGIYKIIMLGTMFGKLYNSIFLGVMGIIESNQSKRTNMFPGR